jgi:hypothetical protein
MITANNVFPLQINFELMFPSLTLAVLNYPFPKILGLVARIPCWRDKKYGSTHLN